MADINVKSLSDEDLVLLNNSILQEQENRTRLARIPRQMQEMRTMYVELGGNAADLDVPIVDAPVEPNPDPS